MAIVQIVANAVKAKLITDDRAIKLAVSDLLSFEVEGAEFTKSFNTGWSGISSFFKMTDATFPAGFVSFVKISLEKQGHVVQVVRKSLPLPLGDEKPVVDAFPDDPRYDYQMDTVHRLESCGRMVAMCATGSGKSRIARLAYKRLNRMTLFLTTRGVLMYQMKDAFEAMGEKVGIIGDGKLRLRNGFNVAMTQTLVAMLKDPARCEQTKRLLARFEFVILEEAHEISGTGYYEILKLCQNAYYRLALTATPFMKANGEGNMRLHAAVGGIGIKVTEKTLIDRGILAKPYFKFIPTERPKFLFKSTSWQSAYRIGIVENAHRNQTIVFEVQRAAKYGLTSIVLVQHKAHGERLKELLTDAGAKCLFMYGEHSQDERKRALDQLKSGKISVLIGSTILDVGVDVPAVGMIVLAGGGKAEVALRQRIGRGLREKKGAGNVAFIVDFCDEHNNHLRAHAATRRAIIEATPGFVEGILKVGEDFNFKELKK
ncbi:MAG: DEAD/DEAH box helicase [Methylobacter sp.]